MRTDWLIIPHGERLVNFPIDRERRKRRRDPDEHSRSFRPLREIACKTLTLSRFFARWCSQMKLYGTIPSARPIVASGAGHQDTIGRSGGLEKKTTSSDLIGGLRKGRMQRDSRPRLARKKNVEQKGGQKGRRIWKREERDVGGRSAATSNGRLW